MNTIDRITTCTLLAACLAMLPAQTRAETVKPDQLKTAINTWVQRVTADARPEAQIDWLEPYADQDQPAAYIAHLTDGGYCLCGGDDRLLPVYHYRPHGTFDPTNPNYTFILESIAKRREKLDNATPDDLEPYTETLAKRAADWQALIAGHAPAPRATGLRDIGPTTMELRVNSAWHQGSPYNDYCPELIPGQDHRAVVGCVATTASQIMYYWHWPPTGWSTGSVEYNRRNLNQWIHEPLPADPNLNLGSFFTSRLYWSATDGGQLHAFGTWDGSVYSSARRGCNNGVECNDEDYFDALEALWDRFDRIPQTCAADFGSTTYNYGIMEDSHSDPPTTGSLEAAKLCHHAGIAVGMAYGVHASSAGLVRYGMIDHFWYHWDAVEAQVNEQNMIEDIRWLRPLEIAGSEPGVGGHSWVVAGYNIDIYPYQFLMNMGWGGGTTEWHSIDEVFPDNQWNTIRLAPFEAVRFVSQWGGMDNPDGRPTRPYGSLAEAIEEAPENTKLIMYAGSVHTLPATEGYARISKPMRLTGHDVTINAQ